MKSWFALCREVALQIYWRMQRLAGSLTSDRFHTAMAAAAACDPAGNRTCRSVLVGDSTEREVISHLISPRA